MPYTLKALAEDGYIMGLPTIGEVATHMDLHYDVYFKLDTMAEQVAELNRLIDGHEEDSIFKYLTDEDKKRMDDELEKAMEESPLPTDPEDF
jgi:DNA-directed RNA polymerase sigma subunit (sigma70/sigma32)